MEMAEQIASIKRMEAEQIRKSGEIEKEKDVPCNPGRQLYRISGILRSVNAPLQHTAVKL